MKPLFPLHLIWAAKAAGGSDQILAAVAWHVASGASEAVRLEVQQRFGSSVAE